MQVSQEAGKVVWNAHHLNNFPQFIVIHTVKGFSGVNEAEVDIFLEFLAFSMIQRMLTIWSVSSTFSKSSLYIWSSQFMYCWSLAWILSITLPACEMSADRQAPLSMEFSRQESWSEYPCPPPGDLPDPRIKPMSLMSPGAIGRQILYHWGHLGNPVFDEREITSLQEMGLWSLLCWLSFLSNRYTRKTYWWKN